MPQPQQHRVWIASETHAACGNAGSLSRWAKSGIKPASSWILVRFFTWATHNGILLDHKKDGNSAICDHMDGPKGYCGKGNMSDRERHVVYISLIYESRKQNKWANVRKQKLSWIQRKSVVAEGRGGGKEGRRRGRFRGTNRSYKVTESQVSQWGIQSVIM